MTAFVASSMSDKPVDPLDVLKVIRCGDDAARVASPDEAAALAGGSRHGAVR